MTWGLDLDPPAPKRSRWGAVLGAIRGLALGGLLITGLAALVTLRGVEHLAQLSARPLSAHLVRQVCRAALAILGLRVTVTGAPLRGRGAIVANHCSWLDILVLNAAAPVFFVAKAEVARWPVIGWVAGLTGTVFIARDPSQAAAQKALFEARLTAGHRLLFFPEGTSSDGAGVLPFKSTLFAAFFTPELRPLLQIQPASLRYNAPEGQDAKFYGWWGKMDFGGHFWQVLCQPRQGRALVQYHPAIALSEPQDRKALAAWAETAVRDGHVALGGQA